MLSIFVPELRAWKELLCKGSRESSLWIAHKTLFSANPSGDYLSEESEDNNYEICIKTLFATAVNFLS
jgi:hypothetical protein